MKDETCELFKLIPRDKLDYLFTYADCELDYAFLGFEDVYKSILNFVPKKRIIIDLGCAYATQSWYFRDYKKYIGIDNAMNDNSVIHTENSEFYFTTIQKFIKDILPTLGYEPDEVFAICSYVPDNNARELVRKTFRDCLVYYC